MPWVACFWVKNFFNRAHLGQHLHHAHLLTPKESRERLSWLQFCSSARKGHNLAHIMEWWITSWGRAKEAQLLYMWRSMLTPSGFSPHLPGIWPTTPGFWQVKITMYAQFSTEEHRAIYVASLPWVEDRDQNDKDKKLLVIMVKIYLSYLNHTWQRH